MVSIAKVPTRSPDAVVVLLSGPHARAGQASIFSLRKETRAVVKRQFHYRSRAIPAQRDLHWAHCDAKSAEIKTSNPQGDHIRTKNNTSRRIVMPVPLGSSI